MLFYYIKFNNELCFLLLVSKQWPLGSPNWVGKLIRNGIDLIVTSKVRWIYFDVSFYAFWNQVLYYGVHLYVQLEHVCFLKHLSFELFQIWDGR